MLKKISLFSFALVFLVTSCGGKYAFEMSRDYTPMYNPGGYLFDEDEEFAQSYSVYEKRRNDVEEQRGASRNAGGKARKVVRISDAEKEDVANKLRDYGVVVKGKTNRKEGGMVNKDGIDLSRVKGARFINQDLAPVTGKQRAESDHRDKHADKQDDRGRRYPGGLLPTEEDADTDSDDFYHQDVSDDGEESEGHDHDKADLGIVEDDSESRGEAASGDQASDDKYEPDLDSTAGDEEEQGTEQTELGEDTTDAVVPQTHDDSAGDVSDLSDEEEKGVETEDSLPEALDSDDEADDLGDVDESEPSVGIGGDVSTQVHHDDGDTDADGDDFGRDSTPSEHVLDAEDTIPEVTDAGDEAYDLGHEDVGQAEPEADSEVGGLMLPEVPGGGGEEGDLGYSEDALSKSDAEEYVAPQIHDNVSVGPDHEDDMAARETDKDEDLVGDREEREYESADQLIPGVEREEGGGSSQDSYSGYSGLYGNDDDVVSVPEHKGVDESIKDSGEALAPEEPQVPVFSEEEVPLPILEEGSPDTGCDDDSVEEELIAEESLADTGELADKESDQPADVVLGDDVVSPKEEVLSEDSGAEEDDVSSKYEPYDYGREYGKYWDELYAGGYDDGDDDDDDYVLQYYDW